jgi:hypothetical protein
MKKVSGFSKVDAGAKKRMAALSAVADGEIDVSDIPGGKADDFKQAVPFRSIWKRARNRSRRGSTRMC